MDACGKVTTNCQMLFGKLVIAPLGIEGEKSAIGAPPAVAFLEEKFPVKRIPVASITPPPAIKFVTSTRKVTVTCAKDAEAIKRAKTEVKIFFIVKYLSVIDLKYTTIG
jgi:hypothetical protein